MENIKALTKIISEIKKLSDEIILAALPLIKMVETKDNNYVKTLLEEIDGIDEDQALQTLQYVALEWVKDAEPLRDEVEKFIIYDDNTFKINNKCKLLFEVWNGDAYDKSGVDGLRELRDELKNHLTCVNEEHFTKTARDILVGD